MRTSNPAFGDRVLREISFTDESTTMTVNGMVIKTLVALAGVFLTAGMTWIHFQKGGNVMPHMIGGGIVGFVVAIATVFKPTWAPYTTPVYALAEGCFLGGMLSDVRNTVRDANCIPDGPDQGNRTIAILRHGSNRGNHVAVFCIIRAGILWSNGSLHSWFRKDWNRI
jgi:hypothetical protein